MFLAAMTRAATAILSVGRIVTSPLPLWASTSAMLMEVSSRKEILRQKLRILPCRRHSPTALNRLHDSPSGRSPGPAVSAAERRGPAVGGRPFDGRVQELLDFGDCGTVEIVVLARDPQHVPPRRQRVHAH